MSDFIYDPAMYEFLSQFKPEESWAIRESQLGLTEKLQEAKDLGFVENWAPKNGPTSCCYYGTIVCKLRGRLFLKKAREQEKLNNL